ncbi:hypothetical protein L9F63_007549, partial [Diploptera punctata]
ILSFVSLSFVLWLDVKTNYIFSLLHILSLVYPIQVTLSPTSHFILEHFSHFLEGKIHVFFSRLNTYCNNIVFKLPNASTILFVVSASVLMRGLPGVDGCNATLNSRLARLAASRSLAYVIAHAAIVICCCIFNAILPNDKQIFH